MYCWYLISCFFERRDGGLTANSRILLQEFIQRFSALQIIEQCLERNARSAKNWFPAMNFRVSDDYALRARHHSSLTEPNYRITSSCQTRKPQAL